MEKQLTVKETAEFLRCSEDTVRGKANDGTLKGSKATGSWLFAQSDVEAYLNGKPSVKVETDEELEKARRNLDLIKVNNQIQAETLGMSVEEYKKAVSDVNTKTKQINDALETFNKDNGKISEYKEMFKTWWYLVKTTKDYDTNKANELQDKLSHYMVDNRYQYHPLQFKVWQQDVIIQWQNEIMENGLSVLKSK